MSIFTFFEHGQVQYTDLIVFVTFAVTLLYRTVGVSEEENFFYRIHQVADFALPPMFFTALLLIAAMIF